MGLRGFNLRLQTYSTVTLRGRNFYIWLILPVVKVLEKGNVIGVKRRKRKDLQCFFVRIIAVTP